MLLLRAMPNAAWGGGWGARHQPKQFSENVSASLWMYYQPAILASKDVHNTTESLMPPKLTYDQLARTARIPNHLNTTHFVYERIDGHRAPLSPTYTGPFPITRRKEKAFLINKNSSDICVSINRLKLAYLAEENQPPPRGEVCNPEFLLDSGHHVVASILP